MEVLCKEPLCNADTDNTDNTTYSVIVGIILAGARIHSVWILMMGSRVQINPG